MAQEFIKVQIALDDVVGQTLPHFHLLYEAFNTL